MSCHLLATNRLQALVLIRQRYLKEHPPLTCCMSLSGAGMHCASQLLACCMSAAQRSTPAPARTLMASQAAAADLAPAAARLNMTAAALP